MKAGSPYGNTRALVRGVIAAERERRTILGDQVDARAVFDDEAAWDDRATHRLLVAFDVFVTFDGSPDETFTLATNCPREVHAALVDDVATEYAANPTSSLGWSVEWYLYTRTEGDSPAYAAHGDPSDAPADADATETPIAPLN